MSVRELYLYGQSDLRKLNMRFSGLDKIAPYLLELGGPKRLQVLSTISGCEYYVEQIQDIFEKIDFLRVCLTSIKELETQTEGDIYIYHTEGAKFFFYTFIYNLKALMDSSSMLLKEIFELSSFRRGNVDIVRNEKFREAVSQSSSQLNQFFKENTNWLRKICEFRDSIIHRHRIPIFIKNKESHAVFLIQFLKISKNVTSYDAIFMTEKKEPTFSRKNKLIGSKIPFTYAYYKEPIPLHELKKKSRSHISDDYLPLLDFCSDSFKRSSKLIELVLHELHSTLSKK